LLRGRARHPLKVRRDGAMNEESVFAAALEKASATERQAYLDEV
jgi:hypothetical protein